MVALRKYTLPLLMSIFSSEHDILGWDRPFEAHGDIRICNHSEPICFHLI